MSPQQSRERVCAQIEPGQPETRQRSDAEHGVDPGARYTQEFIRWLADRLEHDPAFQSRIEMALRNIRVERALSGLRRATLA
jgi:hypothetical protein